MSFDIVIPLGPNEKHNFTKQIEFTKKNIIGYRNIYVITHNPLELTLNDCIIINENIFPFLNFIQEYFANYNNKNNRNGWYFQQLIKLYAGKLIDGILNNYLVIDADVFFLKPTYFFENDKIFFSTGDEHHIPYFTHMHKLDASFIKRINKSGICHHMMFTTNYVNEIFLIVEAQHKKPFWQVFILSVFEHTKHNINVDESGASEYELYFNYMINVHSEDIVIRNLLWENVSKRSNFNIKCDFVSVCNWL